MKKYILLVVSAVALAFTSCSDSEEIEIKYQANITVAVDKLMEPFQERSAGDFDIQEGMSIRIQSYVYDANGILVQSCVSCVNDYSKTVTYSAVLDNGTYKVVSIADFILGNVNFPTFTWWNVTGVNDINTLKVSRGTKLFAMPLETLGAVVNEFEVSEQSSEIKVSVKPATALFQVVFDYLDVVNGDGNGVSMLAPYCSEVVIRSKMQHDMFSEFNSPTFKYSSSASQKQSYNIMSDSPMETIDNGYRRVIGYRALLPQENKTFYWDITMIWPDGTSDESSSDYTPALNIKAGKQYQLYLYLDALQLFFEEVGTLRSTKTRECVVLNAASNNLQNKCRDFGQKSFKVIDIAKTDKLIK